MQHPDNEEVKHITWEGTIKAKENRYGRTDVLIWETCVKA